MPTIKKSKNSPGTNKSTLRALAVLACTLVIAASSQATPITGDPLPAGPFTWNDGGPKSSNADNYDQSLYAQSIGATQKNKYRPYVLFDSSTVGSVTLDFFNPAPGLAYFETRIDGIQTGASPHWVVVGDTIHTGATSVASGNNVLDKIFLANNYVDIRLALGGESDYRFDWTRFYTTPQASVPDGGSTLAMLGLGLAGLGMARRRK